MSATIELHKVNKMAFSRLLQSVPVRQVVQRRYISAEAVRQMAFGMPLTNPSFTRPPYRFFNREIITFRYQTDMDALRAVVPEPLELDEPIVNVNWKRSPDSTGFGDYTECGQVIPVIYKGVKGNYIHSMYLNNHAPIAGGREIWGFPKKLAQPLITHQRDTVVCTLHYDSVEVACGSMGYKHTPGNSKEFIKLLQRPRFTLKIIPNVDCNGARILELVQYSFEDIVLKGIWTSPAALDLRPHVAADLSKLPVLPGHVMEGRHLFCDATLGLGKVVFDYNAN